MMQMCPLCKVLHSSWLNIASISLQSTRRAC
uniref:Uncharacterized protein n=1 Tax=Anguilla anguilla TaxID=7936 RepID=A0A0E9R1P0_ANGAN